MELSIIDYLNNDSELKILLGATDEDTKIYPIQAPQEIESPYVLYNIISDGTLEENLLERSLSFNCIADTIIIANQIRDRIIKKLDLQDEISSYISDINYWFYWCKKVGGIDYKDPELDLFYSVAVFDFKYVHFTVEDIEMSLEALITAINNLSNYIDALDPHSTTLKTIKNLIWQTNTDFDKGDYGSNVEKDGVNGDATIIRLKDKIDNNDNAPFTTPENYTYDEDKIEIVDGKAKLKGSIAGDYDFPFTIPGNYTFDSGKIEVIGGIAGLINSKIPEAHSWAYTDIGNYAVDPAGSIDIISGKARLHDQGTHTNEDDVDYNVPANYIYDSGKVEFLDKGGGNYAAALKGSGGLDLEGWWHLNESSGVTASDSSGKSHDGTLVNMEDEDWVLGKLNNSLIFDGVNEYVNCGQMGSYERTDAFAGDMWVYKSITTQITPVFNKMSPSWIGWFLGVSNLKVYMQLRNGGNYIAVASTDSIALNTWTHIAFSYDGSGVASGIKFWINGILSSHSGTDNLAGKTIINTTDFKICSFLEGGLNYWTGKVDELVLYNTEIDQAQVTARYNGGAGTEDMAAAGYPTDNPTVVQNFDAAFGTVLEWETFTETITEPIGTNIKYNISNDSGATWHWWSGAAWVEADGTYAESNTGTEVTNNVHLFGVGNQRLRIKAFLNSDGGQTPELDNVNVVWYDVLNNYITDGRITTNIGIDKSPDPIWSWDSFIETVEEPANTEIRYVLSNDGGTTWLYWNGSAWVTSSGTDWVQFSTGTDITANIGTFPITNPKMKVRVYLKTTDTSVTPKLNNIQVDYKYGYNYATDNPNIYPNTGDAFTSPLDTFTETVTKPAGSEIKYHVSSDDGVTWKYWNGSSWVETDDTYTQANLASEVSTNIGSLASSGTFKFRALLHSDVGTARPLLDNIYIAEGTVYPIGNNEISMNNDIQPVNNYSYISITETVTKPANTDIKYQYSIDGGGSYNGLWLTKSELETALLALNPVGDGTDKIRFKFQLSTTDSGETPEIDNLNIISDTGYYTSGEYLTNIYNATYQNIDWGEIDINKIEPNETSIKVYIRASNDNTIMGDWSNEKVDGNDADVEGRYVQFKIEFTGTPLLRASLDSVAIKFDTPPTIQIQSP